MSRPAWLERVLRKWVPRSRDDWEGALLMLFVGFTVFATVWRVFEAMSR